MLSLFKNQTSFAILFFVLLFTDICVKINLESVPWRYFSKPLVCISLLVFYLINQNEVNQRRYVVMVLALVFFLFGDIFLIDATSGFPLIAGMIAFMLGKTLYTCRFSHNRDFSLGPLFVFLFTCFGFVFLLLNFIYNKLDELFLPVLAYFFIAVLVAQFAFIRRVDVDNRSFWMVLIGVICAILADSITAMHIFYQEGFAFEKFSVMFFYGLAQYLIVVGVVKERRIKSRRKATGQEFFEPVEDQVSL